MIPIILDQVMQKKKKASGKISLKLVALAVAMVTTCCHSTQLKSNDSGKSHTEKNSDSKDEIAFYFFNVYANDKKELRIALSNVKLVPGKLKSSFVTQKAIKPGSLRFTFIDDSENTIQTEIVDNPLNPIVEYVDDKSALVKKTITKSSADVVIRINFYPRVSHILVERFVDTLKFERIDSFKVN